MTKHFIQFWHIFIFVSLAAATMVTAQETVTKVKPVLTDPVAIVNNTTLNYAALIRAERISFKVYGKPVGPSGEKLSKEQMALERLINRQLLSDAAADQAVKIAPDKVDAALTHFLRRLPGPRAYRALLAELDMSEADLKKELERDLMIEALIEKITRDITIAPEKVKQYYDQYPHLFAENAKIRIREIYLPKEEPPTIDPDLEETIQKIQSDLQEGVPFKMLADRYTPSGQIKNGGDRGYISAGVLETTLEDQLFAMEPEEISEPIETENAVLIIKLVDKQLEQLASFAMVKKEIANYLLADKRQTKMMQYIDQLKAMLIKLIVVVMGVSFTGRIVTWDGSTNLLGYGAALAAVVLALSYFLNVKIKEEKADTDDQ